MRWIPPLCESRRRESSLLSRESSPPHLGRMSALINYDRALRGDDWKQSVFSAHPRVQPPRYATLSGRELKFPSRAHTLAHLRVFSRLPSRSRRWAWPVWSSNSQRFFFLFSATDLLHWSRVTRRRDCYKIRYGRFAVRTNVIVSHEHNISWIFFLNFDTTLCQ